MECPDGLVWDDQIKRCNWESTTCNADATPSGQASSTCVSSCRGKKDGDYQHCEDCDKFVKCANGYLWEIECPDGLVWDQSIKQCTWESTTCPAREISTFKKNKKTNCVSSCKNKKDGDYQSCKRCDGFVKCSGGRLFEMDCAAGGLKWDDKKKRCEWESSTCPAKNNNKNKNKNKNKVGSCVSSCTKMKDGDYQSCKRCDGFVKCNGGRLFEMDCAAGGLVWDDKVKRCEWESSTCPANNDKDKDNSGDNSNNNGGSNNGGSTGDKDTNNSGTCVSSCKNLRDGDYQSCKRCDGFVKCSGGRLF